MGMEGYRGGGHYNYVFYTPSIRGYIPIMAELRTSVSKCPRHISCCKTSVEHGDYMVSGYDSAPGSYHHFSYLIAQAVDMYTEQIHSFFLHMAMEISQTDPSYWAALCLSMVNSTSLRQIGEISMPSAPHSRLIPRSRTTLRLQIILALGMLVTQNNLC
jgi:hypothetical protein